MWEPDYEKEANYWIEKDAASLIEPFSVEYINLLENPQILKTPIVRNGKQATLGYLPDVWKKWE